MTIRRATLLTLLLLAGALSSAQGIEKTLNLQLASQNVFRGTVLTDGFVFQPSLDLGLAPGSHIMLSTSLDLEGSGGFDDTRIGFSQDFNAVAFSGSFGATRFQRDNGFPDTTEVFAIARLPLFGPTIAVYKDIDVVQGLYVRAAKSGSLPTVGLFGAHASVGWRTWLGYSDDNHAAAYYGHDGAGFADLGGRITAEFGLATGTLTAWAQASTLVDPDYRSPNGDRSSVTFGVSLGLKF